MYVMTNPPSAPTPLPATTGLMPVAVQQPAWQHTPHAYVQPPMPIVSQPAPAMDRFQPMSSLPTPTPTRLVTESAVPPKMAQPLGINPLTGLPKPGVGEPTVPPVDAKPQDPKYKAMMGLVDKLLQKNPHWLETTTPEDIDALSKLVDDPTKVGNWALDTDWGKRFHRDYHGWSNMAKTLLKKTALATAPETWLPYLKPVFDRLAQKPPPADFTAFF